LLIGASVLLGLRGCKNFRRHKTKKKWEKVPRVRHIVENILKSRGDILKCIFKQFLEMLLEMLTDRNSLFQGLLIGASVLPGLRGCKSYLLADLFDLPDDCNASYDWIWEHTCFCAIDPGLRSEYVDAVWNCLKPGGTLLAVFYLDPYDEDHGPGQGPPHGSTVYELKTRFAHSGKLLTGIRFFKGCLSARRSSRD